MSRRSARTSALMRGGRTFADAFLIRNHVLVYAVGICPIIAAGIKLSYGLLLAVATALILIPIHLIMSLIGSRLTAWLRPLISVGIGTLILTGLGWVVYRFISPDLFTKLYVFFPLIAVSALVTNRAGVSSGPTAFGEATLDTVGSALGFGLVICVVSFVREIIIYGTILDRPVNAPFTSPVAALPFFAFILLGLLAAFVRSLFSWNGGDRKE